MHQATRGLVFLLAAVLNFTANAQTYLGADAALHRVEELNARAGQTNETMDEQSMLRSDLKAFRQDETNLPPAQAAKGWLELVERAVKLQQQASGNFNPFGTQVNIDDVFDALPSPQAWTELTGAIAARPPAKGGAAMVDMGLRFLAVTLNGDAEGRKREIASLQAKARDANAQSVYVYRSLLQELSQAILSMSDDPEAILTSLERQLDSAREAGMPQPLAIPNLVSQVGPEKADAFLRKALTQLGVVLQFQTPNETSRLTQKLALELIDQVKTPQWGLVNSLDAVELYEALDKRFPSETNKPPSLPGLPDADVVTEPMGMSQKPQAQLYYLLGLISKDRSKEAAAVAKTVGGQGGQFLPDEAFKEMERAGYTISLDNFFYELLSQDPTLPFWDQYVQLAAKAGTTERMLTLARAAAAR